MRMIYKGFFIMFKSISREECISRFKSKHQDKYDYSLVEYNGTNVKVKIICKIHGVFEQTPNNHTMGKGCKMCAIYTQSKSKTKTNDKFISEAISVHGNKYEYKYTRYVGDRFKVSVFCKIHGEFFITPNNHLKGKGCAKCGRISLVKKKTYTSDIFVKKAISIHGNKYDYSLVDYKHNSKEIVIICKTHGKFNQTPTNHLNSGGCPACGILKSKKHKQLNPIGWNITCWQKTAERSRDFDSFKVYIIKCWNDNEVFYKIGRTFLKTKKRFRTYRFMPYSYEILKEFIFETAKDAFDYENELKNKHKEFKYNPNIHFSGINECFTKIIT